MMNIPTLDLERQLWSEGYQSIAGVDEAGRGALAGPVVAAVVILPPDSDYDGIWTKVRDSKQLTALQRTDYATEIRNEARVWSVGISTPQIIDKYNIAVATRLAMTAAICKLEPAPDYLLLDWVRLPQLNIPQQSQPKADQRIVSVAAASIIAKVYRDTLLVDLDKEYPAYRFANHKGYGTAAHLSAIQEHGPCPEHRHSFAPIKKQQTLFSDH
ncbi:ribonuclease HII [Chloroflexi bacterium TSY]|nr:ribonuclease HII [Chloroflexi bacterium TSY]